MNPYDKFQNDKLILRDELAIDRTLLANERTFLAYMRSGVALLLAGVTFIQFASQAWFRIIGVACIPIGIIVLTVGIQRYYSVRRRINSVRLKLAGETALEPDGEEPWYEKHSQ